MTSAGVGAHTSAHPPPSTDKHSRTTTKVTRSHFPRQAVAAPMRLVRQYVTPRNSSHMAAPDTNPGASTHSSAKISRDGQLARLLQEVLKKDYSVGILFMAIIGRGTVVLRDLLKPFMPSLAQSNKAGGAGSSGAAADAAGPLPGGQDSSQSISSLLLSLGLPQEHVHEVLASSDIPADQPIIDLLRHRTQPAAAPAQAQQPGHDQSQAAQDAAGDPGMKQWGLTEMEISQELYRATSTQMREAGDAARQLLSDAWVHVRAHLPADLPSLPALPRLTKGADGKDIHPDDVPMFSNVLEGLSSFAQSSSTLISSVLNGTGQDGTGLGGWGGGGAGGGSGWWGGFWDDASNPLTPQHRELLMHWFRLYLGFSLIVPPNAMLHVLSCMLQSLQLALFAPQSLSSPAGVLPAPVSPDALTQLSLAHKTRSKTAAAVGHISSEAIDSLYANFHSVLSAIIRQADARGQHAATRLLEQLRVDMPCAAHSSRVSALPGSSLAAMAQLMTYGSSVQEIVAAVTTLQARADQAEHETAELVVKRVTADVFWKALVHEHAAAELSHGSSTRDMVSAAVQTEAAPMQAATAESAQVTLRSEPFSDDYTKHTMATQQVPASSGETRLVARLMSQAIINNVVAAAKVTQLRDKYGTALTAHMQDLDDLTTQVSSLPGGSMRQELQDAYEHVEHLRLQQLTLGDENTQLRALVSQLTRELEQAAAQSAVAHSDASQYQNIEVEQEQASRRQLSELCQKQQADIATLTDQLCSTRGMNEQLGAKLHHLIISTQALQELLDQHSEDEGCKQAVLASSADQAAPCIDELLSAIEQDKRRTNELASLCDEGFILVQRLDSQLKAHQGARQLAGGQSELAAQEHAQLMQELDEQRGSVSQLSQLLEQEAGKVQALQQRVSAQRAAQEQLAETWNIQLADKDAQLSKVEAALAASSQDVDILRVQAADTEQLATQELARHAVQMATVKALHACQVSELQAEVAISQQAAARAKTSISSTAEHSLVMTTKPTMPNLSDMQLDDLNGLAEQLHDQLMCLQTEIATRHKDPDGSAHETTGGAPTARWNARTQAMIERIQATQDAANEMQGDGTCNTASAIISDVPKVQHVQGSTGSHAVPGPLVLPGGLAEEDEAFVLPTPPMSATGSAGQHVSIQELLSSRRATSTSVGGSSDGRPPRSSQGGGGLSARRRATGASDITASTTLSLPGLESDTYARALIQQPALSRSAAPVASAVKPGPSAHAAQARYTAPAPAGEPGAQGGTRWSTADSFDEVRHEPSGVLYTKVVYDNPMASYEEMYTNPVAKRSTLAGSDPRMSEEDRVCELVPAAAVLAVANNEAATAAGAQQEGLTSTLTESQRAQIKAWAEAATLLPTKTYAEPETEHVAEDQARTWEGQDGTRVGTVDHMAADPEGFVELGDDEVPAPLLAASTDFHRSAHVPGHSLQVLPAASASVQQLQEQEQYLRQTVSSFGSSQVDMTGHAQLSRISSGLPAGSISSLTRDTSFKVDNLKVGCLPKPRSFRGSKSSVYQGSAGGVGLDVLMPAAAAEDAAGAGDVDDRASVGSGWSEALSTTSKKSLGQRMARKLSKMFSSTKDRQAKPGVPAE